MTRALVVLQHQLDALQAEMAADQQLRQRGLRAALEQVTIDARIRAAYAQGRADERHDCAAFVAREIDALQGSAVDHTILAGLLHTIASRPAP